MKKKHLLIAVLCVFAVLMLALSVSAECTEHTYKWTVDVSNRGFLGEVKATGTCDCGATTSETLDSPFVYIGFSNSDDGVVQSYAVNKQSLKRYEELTGQTVKFGAVITTRNAIGNNNPLNAKGEALNEKVKVVDFTDTKYNIIDVAIRGVPEELKNSAEMIFAMYVQVNNKIVYLDNSIQKEECSSRSYETVDNGVEFEAPSATEEKYIDKVRYEKVNLNFELGYFWNNSSFQSSTDKAFRERYWGTVESFTKETLPVGSMIYVDSANGWQYRPHKWSGTRPGNTKETWVVVDESWWGSFSNVGFNISNYLGTGASDNNGSYINLANYTEEQIAEIFKIYIPVQNVVVPDVPVEPEEPDVPTERPDYSDQKQNWNDDNALKILAIGNSFSVDSMEYVYQVAKSAGIETVVLGNLYIGGCSLDTHYNNAVNNSGAYTYYTNSNGTWSSNDGVSIKTAVESDDWDFISMQQVSGNSGVESSYSNLDKLVDIVEPLNPSARLVWHMTWAYQKDSGHSDFAKYNKDQMTMYNAIVSVVQSQIVTDEKFDIVIPAGTSIQNVRTSYIGDTLTRDGYHLSYDYGRLIGSLTFVKALTGVSIDNVTYMPSGVDENELAVAIECVNNACATPFSVTNSSYDKAPETDVGALVELPLDYLGLVKSAYYNSGDANYGQTLISHSNSTANNLDNFYATKKFTKEMLPVGSVIYIASNWQYRPERWPGSRPGNTSTETVTVDESWWDEETVRAFNISLKSGGSILSYEPSDIAEIFKIYVPESALEANKPVIPEEPETPTVPETVYVKSTDCATEVVIIDGKEYRALSIEGMGLTATSYYFSEQQGPTFYLDGSSMEKNFFATKTFTKDTLPNGAIIWVNSGWRYRPEGWITETTYNSGSTRPGNVSTTYVTTSDAWWSNWTIRGFNISKSNGTSIDSLTLEEVYANFKIYIPVENIQD